MQRAVRLAIWHTALAAAAGLLFGFGFSELCIDLIEIFTSYTCFTLLWHVAFDVYELQHRLFGHGTLGHRILKTLLKLHFNLDKDSSTDLYV